MPQAGHFDCDLSGNRRAPGRPMKSIAVVGGSLAGLEAATRLRQLGYDGSLLIYSQERRQPYDRPPLSKGLLTGVRDTASVALTLGESAQADWRMGVSAVALDARRRELSLSDGSSERFDGIVIATGAAAIRPRAISGRDGGIHVLRTLDDAISLRSRLHQAPARVVIVGAGFIGLEVASSCRELGLQVSVIEARALPLEPALGSVVAGTVAAMHRDHGVDLRLGVTVVAAHGAPQVERLDLSDGTSVSADVVVYAVGVQPETGWLVGSGLTVDGGVVCDEACGAAPGIVAAGDVARWPHRRYGIPRRIEHWDNAIRQAHHAASTLLANPGPPAGYDPVPWFWSDQHGSKLQVAGYAGGADEFRVVHGSLEARRFVGLYRRGDEVGGAVAIDDSKAFLACRRLLLDPEPTWSKVLAGLDSPVN